MIKHIVMWKLLDSAGGHDKASNAATLKQQLEALRGKIPGLLSIEVGVAISTDADSSDVVLYSEFEDQAALDAYLVHPLHQEIVPFAKAIRSERRVIDYSVTE